MPVLKEMGWKRMLLKRGSIISDNRVYILVRGNCYLCSSDSNNSENNLIYFTPGMMMNFWPAIDGFFKIGTYEKAILKRESFTIRARTNCELLYLEEDAFIRAFDSNVREINFLLVQSLVYSLKSVVTTSSSTKLKSIAQRVSRYVYENVSREKPHLMKAGITYTDIANQLSIHSVTVFKVFRILKEQGIIVRQGRKIEVTDLDRLWKLVSGETPMSYRRGSGDESEI